MGAEFWNYAAQQQVVVSSSAVDGSRTTRRPWSTRRRTCECSPAGVCSALSWLAPQWPATGTFVASTPVEGALLQVEAVRSGLYRWRRARNREGAQWGRED